MALDQAALAAWRTARGRVGVQALPEVFPDAPFTLRCDFGGLMQLVTMGKVRNPLIEAALADQGRAVKRIRELEDSDDSDQPGLLTARWEAQRANEEWADAVLAAFIVEPPYCPLADLPPGGCPPEQVCLFDFPPEVRGPLVSLAIGGWEELESFRQQLASTVAVGDDGTAGPTAEPDPDSAISAADPVVAGRRATPAAGGVGAAGAGRSEERTRRSPDQSPRRLHTRSA